jgi:hypothetical protein
MLVTVRSGISIPALDSFVDMRILHSAITSPIYELAKTFELNQNLQDWDSHAAFRFRVVASSVTA